MLSVTQKAQQILPVKSSSLALALLLTEVAYNSSVAMTSTIRTRMVRLLVHNKLLKYKDKSPNTGSEVGVEV